MTPDERSDILSALHELELRFTDRLARLEEGVKGYNELKQRVNSLDTKLETEAIVMRDRSNRLLVGLTIVALIALGDLGTRLIPLF